VADRTNFSDDARDKNPGIGEQAGEGVGGIGGALAGAGIGSVAGPIGTIIGGVAGALGGWWAGEKVGRAAEDFGDHEPYYREHFDANRLSDVDWNTARTGYGLGHVAGRNPSYRGRGYDEIETDLRKGWKHRDRDFDTMRPYVRTGFERTSKSDWSDL
jgi:hypothetical protein